MPRYEKDYRDFVGGLNTVTANDSLADLEFPELKNIDLGTRGSMKRRYGMVKEITPFASGQGQGFFRIHRRNRKPLTLYAVDGKLYQEPNDEVELNDTSDITSHSSGTDYEVLEVQVPNADVTTNPTVSDTKYTVVSSITASDQVALVDESGVKKVLVSVSNADTGWTSAPTDEDAQRYFMNNRFSVYYNVYSEYIEITGLEEGFQNIRPIEAVQYRDKLYIATGTKLVEFDGVNAKVVSPHKPNSLEAMYIGTNALADDPDNFMSDSEGAELRIDGVTSDYNKGIVNTKTTFTVYIAKPTSISTVEYQYSYKAPGDDTYTVDKDWSTDKTWEFVPDYLGQYEFDIKARDAADTTNEARFIVPKYNVYEEDLNESIEYSALHRCNRIILHWQRLILYHDDLNSGLIFVSHLQQPNFFPTPNTLLFENKESEPLMSVVKYRDMLVAFTPSTIQALYGTNPTNFRRIVLNTGIGCIAPYTSQVTSNYITFLSRDGVYALSSLSMQQDHANVEKLDKGVDNVIDRSSNACAVSHNEQYHLCFPDTKKRMRFYYEQGGVWTKDESEKLDFIVMHEWEGDLYAQSQSTGTVYRFDESVFDDDGYVYEDRIESKEYDFNEPYLLKKMKRLKLFMETQDQEVNVNLYIYLDGVVALTPKTEYAETVDGVTSWVTEINPNLVIRSGTVLGGWVMGSDAFGSLSSRTFFKRLSGRFRRAKIIFSHTEATPNQVLGFGFVFIISRGE